MSERESTHHELLLRVAAQLAKTPSSTDHLILTKWRVLSLCQYVVGGSDQEVEEACCAALRVFAGQGPGNTSDTAVEVANEAIRRAVGRPETILPAVPRQKRIAVGKYIDASGDSRAVRIEFALRVLPAVRERVKTTVLLPIFPGIRHRLELIAGVLEDTSRSESHRALAAAAVLYIDKIRDVVPDTLGLVGLMDDDHALRIALERLGADSTGPLLHWSERISSLWDDLPFLQGVNLQRDAKPVSVTWLDRVNSYVSYCHVFAAGQAPLLLLQPSVACSPVHTVVSLIGLLVLDALTSSQSKAQTLRAGQTYEVDGFVVRFEGTSGPPTPGWLRLRMREGVGYQPPGLADRMIPIEARRLSSLREFSSRRRADSADPIQRLFGWDTAIGAAAIFSRLAVVASRRRMVELFGGVQSNGVRLLDQGLVRFVSAVTDELETHGALVLVLRSLTDVRLLLDRGIQLQAVVVDGYRPVSRGRHELPFLMNRPSAPPIIIWSAKGYYPAVAPQWLPAHRHLEVSADDLASILELDTVSSDLAQSSLWEAATGLAVKTRPTMPAPSEKAVVDAIDDYLQVTRTSASLPEYWKYHLLATAKSLRALIAATPSEWSEIKRFATCLPSAAEEMRSSLRPSAVSAIAKLTEVERLVLNRLNEVSDTLNSCARALIEFLSATESPREQWYFVCDEVAHAEAIASLLRGVRLRGIEPVLLRDLAVCCNCVVAGWISTSFVRRLFAHTPRAIVALVDESDGHRWRQTSLAYARPGGQSLLTAIGGVPAAFRPPSSRLVAVGQQERGESVDADSDDEDERIPCVFLWALGERDAKVLALDSRVVVEEGDIVRESVAWRIRPENRVILGFGMSRWSPADEFTGAVVEAVHKSHPRLVEAAKEWRKGLLRLRERQQLTMAELRSQLAGVGVEREDQTLEGWLEIDRAAPIAPRRLSVELAALWPLVDQYVEHSLDDVTSACARLRALRAASGRALLQLWKGRTVELGVDEAWLDDLVDRLRQDVRVCEVEAATPGQVPRSMLGWWIPHELASRFASNSSENSPASDHAGEDDDVVA